MGELQIFENIAHYTLTKCGLERSHEKDSNKVRLSCTGRAEHNHEELFVLWGTKGMVNNNVEGFVLLAG